MVKETSIPTEHRNTMRTENESSGKSSTKKKIKSCSLKLEAHRLKAVGSSQRFRFRLRSLLRNRDFPCLLTYKVDVLP